VSEPGVHARVAVEQPRDCPLARVVDDLPVRDLVPASGRAVPQVVVSAGATTGLADRAALDPVVVVDDGVVCRLTPLAGGADPCDHDHCLAHGFDFLPVEPYTHRVRGGRFELAVATTDGDRVEAAIGALRDAGFEARTEQLSRGGSGPGAASERAVVDLSSLTTRQRELARFAAERGYFDPDGPAAETVAAELDIAKATLSEHLRRVQREVAAQLFSE
jgi:hypothetical protein